MSVRFVAPKGWALVPLKPSRKLVNDLATEWAYTTEEACESYQGFLGVVARHGFGGSDPAAYDEDASRETAVHNDHLTAERDELLGLLARVRMMFRLDLAKMLAFGRDYNQAVKDVHDAVDAALYPLEASVSVGLKGE